MEKIQNLMPDPTQGKYKSRLRCFNCGYYIISPYPADLRCPNCNKFVIPIGTYCKEKFLPLVLYAERIRKP